MSFFKRDANATQDLSDGKPDDSATVPVGTVAAVPPIADAPPPRGVGRVRLLLMLALCVVNAALSGLLLLHHHGESVGAAAVGQVCGSGDDSGCDKVAHSRFAQVRGMPLGGIGIVFYGALAVLLVLALLAGPETRAAAGALVLLALTLALAADVALFGIQLVAIRAFCKLCLLTYAVNGLALVLALPARRDGRVVGESLLRPDGRLAFAGWAIATVALGAGVVAAESALDHRERDRVAGLLGGPAAAAAPVAPPTAAPLVSPAPGTDVARFQEEARVATEQARRLQEILDDPRKLDQYFAEKAAREFEQGPVHPLKLEGTPYKGPAQAPIRVTEFSDFLCPFCKNIAGAFASYLPASAGRVSVYFKNYPLDSECNPNVASSLHPGACHLARGGLCAHEQGRFWPYHDKVFFGTPLTNPAKADVARLAGEAGLDAAAFQACVDTPRIKEKLAAEIAEAKASGVDATPTLFVNGKRLPRINDFTQTVEKEAQKLGLPPLPAPH
jgi:protein-disulfide isomerase/uncharacterized membrane protein